MQRIIQTSSAEETQRLGQGIGRYLTAGMIIGLCGDLGTGKTCLVKGIATGLGIAAEEVVSPTFTLVTEHYRGRIPLYHLDLYRLEGVAVEELGFEEYLFGRGVAVIEWFQFLTRSLGDPGDLGDLIDAHLLVAFEYGEKNTRILTLTPNGEQYERLVAHVSTRE